jgi:hypothetical protein
MSRELGILAHQIILIQNTRSTSILSIQSNHTDAQTSEILFLRRSSMFNVEWFWRISRYIWRAYELLVLRRNLSIDAPLALG